MDGRHARRVLGVNADAGPDEIRRAFRMRAQVAHPDHGGSADQMAELTAAYDVLRTELSRPVVLRAALPRTGPHFDAYDSAPRPTRRDFADVLRGAFGRMAS